jgi:hypothetical protein
LVKQPETVVAVNANGDLLVGNASSATVKSAEGRVSHLDTDGDQVLARASSAYEQNQASRLAKIYGADSAGNNLLDLVESFKSLTTERSVDREQSTTLLGEFNRLLEGGATDQAADLLKSTNQLLQSDETNVVTSLNLTRLKSGETIAVVHSEDPDSGFALMRSTYGESQTDQNGVISTEFADGWRTVKEPHPDFESDDEHYRKYYSPQDRLAKIEYQAGLGSSVRQFSEDAAGNVTSMKETNSAGITTTLTKQQQGDWLLQMKQTHGSLTKHRFESASFEDIVTGKRSATDGTQVKFYLDGDREWFTPDHRVRSERANGRVDLV